ncbi:alpha/beta fold hydrolase [Hymenobacter aquaticus]|uniref:Alpha/beta fold hydrolase n=1 Tax=Hymenobacter aquaticus TaxID=1867101 RepID=A0A4Z0Q7V7_9BACT|nr:alpha/beta fold hydrolase [Hymenobacter aquaticus]TGE25516.1 alpha/beta fold hydrolase [Hymenobacter aquaticus]
MKRIASSLVWLILLLLPALAGAQSILLKGKVIDQTSQAPVGFATLGIKDHALGSVANAEGEFQFSIPANAVSSQENVVISCLGYQTALVPLTAFAQGPQLIRLRHVDQALREVVVHSGKVKSKTFGRTASSTLMVAAMYTESALVSDELAKEQGTILKIDRDCYLRDVNFHVAFNRFASVTFRLNLYSVRQGLPDQPLLTQDVRVEVTQPRGWVKIDLTNQNLHLRGLDEVAVTLQWLRSEARAGSTKAFGISAVPAPGHSILFRDKSQAAWREVKPGYLSFFLSADSYGNSKATPAPAAAEYTLPDSLRYLRYLAAAAPANRNSHHYGDSAAVGRYVAVAGSRLYVERYGSGPPLLLLHGNGQSIAAFNQQIGMLARHFQVIAVDTRAQGKSQETAPTDLSYDLFAADVKQLLDSLHLRNVNLVGWSDGGNTALKLALRYPAYVNRMVVMGANLFPTDEAVESGLLQLFRRQLQALGAQTDATANTQKRLLRLLLQEPQMSFAELRAITAPTLVLAGEHDVVLEKHTRAIAASIPGAKLHLFKGASHFAPQEVPQEFNEVVRAFLAR